MTPEQRENLAKLSAYLKSLPADYARFEMATYLGTSKHDSCSLEDTDNLQTYLLANGGLPGCGTVACAVGHGPAAHIFMIDDELVGGWCGSPNWEAYAERVFGCAHCSTFAWMFGGNWNKVDNTAKGAALRIDYFLANGVPEEFEEANKEWVEVYQ